MRRKISAPDSEPRVEGVVDLVDSESKAVWVEDSMSMCILLVLYTLQGIPMGLSGSLPLIMKEKGVSYEGLSLFSLVALPFSLKLLWAPIVDSIFIQSVGRRKSWLIPVQILCGILMVISASHMEVWMGDANAHKGPNVELLTGYFMLLYFLMATQDIAVDGWALTMLSRKNVGYASMCNAVGQSFGYFLANQGFIALSDPTWCKRFLGMTNNATLVNLPGFMQFWGVVFLVTTLFIWVGKTEKPLEESEIPEGVVSTYKQVISIFKLRPVQLFCIILLTRGIAWAPTDSAGVFKMQENGMPKADIASISPLLMVIGLVLPAVIGGVTSSNPLDVLLLGAFMRTIGALFSWLVIQSTKAAYATGTPSFSFFTIVVLVSIFNEVGGRLVFVSMMAYFAKISDPNIGGTYMTLLATIANLGALWSSSAALWILPKLSFSHCVASLDSTAVLSNHSKACFPTSDECSAVGGVCKPTVDGFTILVFCCVIFGMIWMYFARNVLTYLQSLPHTEWLVTSSSMKSITSKTS